MAIMWKPKYDITDKLLYTIRQIGEVIGGFRNLNLSSGALAKLEFEARILSSFASTSIEGNPLPLTDVKRIIKNSPRHIRDTEKEVLNYNRALEYVYDKVKKNEFKLTHEEIKYIQSIVIDGLMDNPEDVGKYRKRAVVIRDPKNADNVNFIPPDYKDVLHLMEGLIRFINDNSGKIDPILLAGLFHKQHVIIHPFMDGNGRTTRLITTALLGKDGLDLFEIFSLEDYYNKNVTKYFRYVGALGDYYDIKDGINFTSWLEYFAEGILDELKRVQQFLPDYIQPVRLEEYHKQILSYVEEHGSISQREYADISDRSLAARKLDFKKLIELKLIKPQGQGKSTYYVKS